MKIKRHWLIIGSILGIAVIGGSAGTWAYFQDTEGSSDNLMTGFTSSTWLQTTQSDFNSGVLSAAVETTSSPGDAKLSLSNSANLILLFDGATIPGGWTDVSATGQPFVNRFIRGAATYGGTGGATSHTHTVSLVSFSTPSASVNYRSGGTARASGAHTHTLSSATTASQSNLPSYRNLRVIRATGVPATIPAGAIAIFDTTVPSGWTRYSAEDNYFVRGATSAGGTGGANSHTQGVTITIAANTSFTNATTTKPRTAVAQSNHTHTISGTADSQDNRPPYITVILGKADAATTIPPGMIAMFDATPNTNAWSVLSGSGGAFENRFIVGSSAYGTTGGNATHQHSNLTMVTGGPSSTANARTDQTTASFATNTHTHTVVVSFSAESNLPPYIDVIFAKAAASVTGTLDSQVLDTTFSSARWDALAWTVTTPASTTVTLWVRARDTSFLKTDDETTGPVWTSMGSTSPVQSGLTAGRYKQWRATLNTTNVAQTPTLSDVSLYYSES